MSVVVAIKHNNKVYMGCDSQVTTGGSRITLKNPNNYKVWKVKGVEHCLMGSVGNLRDACVIRTSYDLVTDYNVFNNQVCFDFVVNSVLPDIISLLEKAKYIKMDDYFESMDSSYLFAFQNQLYAIYSDGSVFEIEDFVAIGSGSCEAIGSLLSTEGLPPEERIIKAIKASAAHDIYVDYPIIISNTRSTHFNVITDKDESEYIKGIKSRITSSQQGQRSVK